jgi:hypothetical protein
LTLSWQGTRFCVAYLVSFATWSLWLALGLVLAGQLYIASTSELEVPAFLLRSLESRLAATGVRAEFGRTSFDPTGRVLIEDVRVSLPAFAEPVVRARAVYVQLDPWALAAGRFDPRKVQVTGAALAIPAMLSRSGAAEEILRDLDATIIPGGNAIAIPSFPDASRAWRSPCTAPFILRKQGDRPTPARGGFHRAPFRHDLPANRRHSAAALRPGAARASFGSRPFRVPRGHCAGHAPRAILEAKPAEPRVVPGPLPIRIIRPRIETRIPLLGDAPVAVSLEFDADELALPFSAQARRVRALVRGTLRPAQLAYVPLDLELSADSLAVANLTASGVAARLTPGPLPQLGAELAGRLMGNRSASPPTLIFAKRRRCSASAGSSRPPFSARSASGCTSTCGSTSISPPSTAATAPRDLAPAGILRGCRRRSRSKASTPTHVRIDEGRAEVEFDGRRFRSPSVWARIGENFAHGSYDQDLVTRDYRFLLDGQLRPLAISGWFTSGWWANFFEPLELPVAPPEASVDVQGRWGDGRQSKVFVFVDTTGLVFRGGRIDHARSRLFIRPGYFDGLEFAGTSGPGEAHGTFTFLNDGPAWRRLDFNVASTIDLALVNRWLGAVGQTIFEPFTFAQSPALKVSARLDGPSAPGARHQSVDIEGRSAGEFRLHGFPLESIAFTATVRDDAITVENLHAGFAGES